MSLEHKQRAIFAVIALESKLQIASDGDGGLSHADCAVARQAVETARYLLPSIVLSTLLHRIGQAEQWLAQREQ